MTDDAKVRRGFQAMTQLEKALDKYTFAGTNEAQVQKQVLQALTMERAFSSAIHVLGSEVVSEVGRYDILVDVMIEATAVRVVIELKVKGTAEAAERQAQRYAKAVGVDAVVIASTSSRLMGNIRRGTAAQPGGTLGGKPLGLIYLRPF